MFDLAGLRGISRAIDVNTEGRTLGEPDEECKFVKISNWTTDDTEENNLTIPSGSSFAPEQTSTEIYYGYDKTFAHQLFAGRETDFLPCQNLGQISVRTNKSGNRKVFFTFYF
jgi:hypothetical protein